MVSLDNLDQRLKESCILSDTLHSVEAALRLEVAILLLRLSHATSYSYLVMVDHSAKPDAQTLHAGSHKPQLFL